MANELTIRGSMAFEKSGTVLEFFFGPTNRDVAGSQGQRRRQTIGTSEEVIDLGDSAAGGYFCAVNRDATNYVEIRPGSGLADLIKLLPGDFCMFRLASDATPYAIANTGACDLDYLVIDP